MEGGYPATLICSELIIYAFIVIIIIINDASAAPTDGFVQQPLDESNLRIQKPYDKNVNERYNFTDGVHYLWVYKYDKPHDPNSHTAPRTEIRITGYDYICGVWQFEGDLYVPRGTWGTCVMQVFGGVVHATSLQLGVYDGKLKRYTDEVVVEEVYEKWIHLNVIHDADEGKVHVFVDGDEKLVADDRGKANHYFKCGVYSQNNPSERMESRWRDIKLWKKGGGCG